jgi:PKD repeat protein
MKKEYFKSGLIAIAFLATSSLLFGQNWVDGMRDPSVNFYTVQEQFNQYWDNRDQTERGKGWKQFKRWEYFTEQRVYPTGERPSPTVLWEAYQQAKADQPETGTATYGDWKPLGPNNGNAINGIGRINGITFDPNNTDIIWAGAPSGGLWKSTDKGQSWETNTDLLPNLGVSVIVINPKNTEIMYIATGDRDVTDTYSYGVLKSVNGGQTWSPTGLSFTVTQFRQVTGLIIDPDHPDTLTAATSVGIFSTYDGGDNWTQRQPGNFSCLVHKPGDFNVQYAATRGGTVRIWRSANGGANWSAMISNGLPPSGLRRAEIAVTPHDPNYVYILYGASTNGFHSVYRSTDDGANFTMRANSPNLLGWNTTGSDTGGQAWYDLCIAVSPTNKEEVYVGGVNIWKSTNGGSSWNINAHWTGASGTPYVHADHHCFAWEPGTSNLWNGNDGGVSRTNNGGNTWADRNNTLEITQYYRIGLSATNENIFLGGTQDNGTHRRNNALTWARVRGGDGMECAVDHEFGNIMYASIYYGNFRKSTNTGNNFNASFNLPPSGTGNWVTPFVIDPSNSEILYAGFTSLWKSTNRGVSFTSTSPAINGSTNLNAIAVAPSNGQVIYVASQANVFRSVNGGSSWVNVSGGQGGTTTSYIAVSDYDPMKVWVSKSGYSANTKLFYSENGGDTWINLSAGLPNLPVNCVLFENGSDDGVYVGTDIGVYYRDNATNGWVPFMDGLPNVVVNELEIQYDAKVIRAATYGRGVWESPIYSELQRRPQADFVVNPQTTCNAGDTIVLTSTSAFKPETFKWFINPSTFQFVNGTSDTSKIIQIVASQPGSYHVALEATNNFGTDRIYRVAAFIVGGNLLPFFEDFEDPESLARWTINNPDGGITWARGAVGGNGSDFAVFMNFYNYQQIGQIDELITPLMNVANHDSLKLTFDYAYRRYPYAANRSDTLKIFVSNDCGNAWVQVAVFADNGNNNFATGSPAAFNFSPTNVSNWCGATGNPVCQEIDLTSFVTGNSLLVKFQSVNDYGNNLYLDNIFLSGVPNAAPIAYFAADTITCAGDSVQFYDLSSNSPSAWDWTFVGGAPSASTQQNPRVSYPNPGIYPVTLISQNGVGQDTITRTSYINVQPSTPPAVTVSAPVLNYCPGDMVTFTANVSNGGPNPTYTWAINGNPIGGNRATVDIPVQSSADVITVEVVSDAPCAQPANVTSTGYSVVVNTLPNLTWSPPVNGYCLSDGTVTLSGVNLAGGTFSGPGVNNQQFTPAAAGVGNHRLFYDYTTSDGCQMRVETTITVQSAPSVFLNLTDVCTNDGQFSMNWGFPFNGNYEINGVPSAQFDATAFNVGQRVAITYNFTQGFCTTTRTDTLTMVPPPPKPTVVVDWGVLTCTDSGAFTYQWLDANGNAIPGATGQSYSPPTTGWYSVRLQSGNSCTETSEQAYLWTIGLPEVVNPSEFVLFPNPNDGRFTLRFESPSREDALLQVYDATGKKVYEQIINATSGKNEMQINPGYLATGIYSLRLVQNEHSYGTRFTVF